SRRRAAFGGRHAGAHHRRPRRTADRHHHRPGRRALLPLGAAARPRAQRLVREPAMENHMIRASNLTVRLSGKTIVQGVSLEARAGQITAIVGPNGSGKTTTLKAVAGEIASEGAITLNGRDIRALEPWQLAVRRAVLPQAAVVALPFTVREIVRLDLSV